jgi:hypothetical protein
MDNYITKYFGQISIDKTSDFEYIDLMYENKEINISLSDCNIYGDKLKTCINIIDKYPELNKIAKKAILENFHLNDTIKYYFECHFDILDQEQVLKVFGVKTFEEFDIKRGVDKLDYPNLLFGIENNEINFSVDYKVSKLYSNEILSVVMDEKLNVNRFSHES